MKLSTLTRNFDGLGAGSCRADSSTRTTNGRPRVRLVQGGARVRPSHRLIALLIATVMAVALVMTPAPFGSRVLAHSLSCRIGQITFTTEAFNADLDLSADGTRLAFLSNGNLTGGNADLSAEIFLFDATTNNFTQVTDTTGEFVNFDLSISGDGTHLAFKSSFNPTGANADGNREIFLFDTATNDFTQVTDTTEFGDNDDPALSHDGSRFAFRSTHDLTGGNADGNQEIFLYDRQSNSFTQVTNTTGINNFDPALSGDGLRLAFQSLHNLTGSNADGNFEVFIYDIQTSNISQVTDTTGGTNGGPSLNNDGTRLAFQSNRDLGGGNPDGNFEVFLYDAASGITQVTNTTGEIGFFANFGNAISGNGTTIGFLSNRDLTGGNADGNNEVFHYDSQTGFTQITDTTGEFNLRLAISGDGMSLAFGSNRDLTGGNADGNLEIFLATCLPDSDDDGIPDDSDPDTVADVINTLPNTNFNSAGNKNAFLSRLEGIEQLILAGNIEQAIQELQNLRRRVDGCGSAAESNDWITDCAAQLQVRALIDTLIANLST